MDRDARKGKEKCKELSTGDVRKRKERTPVEKRKQLPTGDGGKRRKMLRVPRIWREPDEVERLRSRPLKDIPKLNSCKCLVCLSNKHLSRDCPCLEKIPEGQTLGPSYDFACIACGKLDIHPCCGKGHYAVVKYCGGCQDGGHWFWELRCPKGQIFNPLVVKPPGVEYEELPFPAKIGKFNIDAPGFWRIKEVERSNTNENKSNKWKSIGSKLVSGVKKLVL